MDAIIVFQILTAFILALFAGVFFLVYLYDRRTTSSGWFSLAYMLVLAFFFVDVTGDKDSLPATLLAHMLFWGSSGAIAGCGAARAGNRFPLRSFAALVVAGLAANLYFTLVDFDPTLRKAATNMVSGGIIATCLPGLNSVKKRPIDRAFFFCIAAAAASYIFRPVIVFGVMGLDYQSDANAGSTYSLVLYMTTSIFALGMAAVALIACGLEITERLQRESDTDHLTGLFNRRGMANLLEDGGEIQFVSGVEGQAVLMFDIDHFKRVNDEFGHGVGDKVLAKIGRTVQQLMKYHGHAGRLGGEEFIFLFTVESSPAAFLVSEHLRVAIGMLRHEGMPIDRRATISLGLAFIREGESLKQATRRADIALYQAKEEGRNRLRIGEGDILPDFDESKGLPV